MLTGAAVTLIGWMVVLAVVLPGRMEARHWSTAWLGLDAMEVVGLLLMAAMVRRRDPRASVVAAATGAVFVVDAWFDSTTAGPQWALLEAYSLALVFEIPAAVACGVLALTALTWRTSRTDGPPVAAGTANGPDRLPSRG